jgi:hypothetical protein
LTAINVRSNNRASNFSGFSASLVVLAMQISFTQWVMIQPVALLFIDLVSAGLSAAHL